MATEAIIVDDLALKEFEQRLNSMAMLLDHRESLMQELAGIMMFETEEQFRLEGDPAWPALAPSTLRSLARRGNPGTMLHRSQGGLHDSIQEYVTADTAMVGTNKVYAAIQQLGGVIKIHARSQRLYFHVNGDGEVGNRFVKKHKSNYSQWGTMGDHEITIPPRPFFRIRSVGIAKMDAAVAGYLTGS